MCVRTVGFFDGQHVKSWERQVTEEGTTWLIKI